MSGSTVTVSGATFTFTGHAGLSIAQQIANALAAASSVSVTSSSGSGSFTGPSTPGATQELGLSGSGSSTVTGFQFISNTAGGPSTINAATGTSIITSTGGGLFVESGAATIAAAG